MRGLAVHPLEPTAAKANVLMPVGLWPMNMKLNLSWKTEVTKNAWRKPCIPIFKNKNINISLVKYRVSVQFGWLLIGIVLKHFGSRFCVSGWLALLVDSAAWWHSKVCRNGLVHFCCDLAPRNRGTCSAWGIPAKHYQHVHNL